MEILLDKTISTDELIIIAYSVPPSSILNFCHINKLTDNICGSSNFWHDYINADQNKYNKLIVSIAKNGNSKLFSQLWGNGYLKPKNIISEPYLLGECYKVAYLNGHDDLTNILYMLNNTIYPYTFNISDNFDLYIKWVYDWWDNTIINKKNILSEQQKETLEHNKFDIIIAEVLMSGNYNYAIELIKERLEYVPYKYYLAHANSIKTFRKLASNFKKMGYSIDYNVIEEVVMTAITISNFRLAEELIKAYHINNEHLYKPAISSSSDEAFDFVMKHISSKKIIQYPHSINNKKIVYYILNRVTDAKKWCNIKF